MELQFGRHTSQLLEIFWKPLNVLLFFRQNKRNIYMYALFINKNDERYSQAKWNKNGTMEN